MTLQIKGVQIAGIPAITIRNMLRRVNQVLHAPYVADRCKVSARRAKEIIETLVADGFLEFAERSRQLAAPYRPGKEKPRYRYVDFYKLTDKGNKLAQASAIGKMSRAKAEQIIAECVKRVEEINANADYMFKIPTVIVYGSYVRGEQYLSDVDIAIDLERKRTASEREWDEWAEKRVQVAEAKGRKFSDVGHIWWPENEVKVHLKTGTKGLSLHDMDDFMGMKKDSNFAYKVLLGDATRVAEQISRGRRWRENG